MFSCLPVTYSSTEQVFIGLIGRLSSLRLAFFDDFEEDLFITMEMLYQLSYNGVCLYRNVSRITVPHRSRRRKRHASIALVPREAKQLASLVDSSELQRRMSLNYRFVLFSS